MGRCEVDYRASIGEGFKILHPSLGLVIPDYVVIGDYFIATGGNCIGTSHRGPNRRGDVTIGNHVVLGANSVVLSPVRIGHYGQLAAGSVLMKDVRNYELVGGVPARTLMVNEPPAEAAIAVENA